MDVISLGMAAGISSGLLGVFFKSSAASVCFAATTSAVSLGQDISVAVGGVLLKFPAGSPVVMPALSAGTDYAIYACADGTLQASANFSAPAGYTAASARQIGGFHFAPGSCAAAQAGGDTTPQINPYSLWDIKWRPACPDPRGMALVAGRFWADIYLTGTDVDAVGSSRYGVTIADGSSPPKVPAIFGGNGSTTYGSFTWFQAGELLASVGKGLLDYADFATAAYGVKEQVSRGNDPGTTGFATTNAGSSNADQNFTSKWGLIQAAGVMWVWGRELGGGYNGGWASAGQSRGSAYNSSCGALLGAAWDAGAGAGSRASAWNYAPWNSGVNFGARGRSDHLRHV